MSRKTLSKLKPVLSLFTVAALSASVVLPALADETKTPSLDKREQRQEKRIEGGEKTGQLTPQEAADLQAREAKLKSDEAAAKADGKVTGKERRELQREANQDSRAIERDKHNKERVKKEKKQPQQ